MNPHPPNNPEELNPEDYNEISEERIKLLNRMDNLLNHKLVPTAFWAVQVYSDLTQLTIFVTETEKSSYLLEFCMHACSALGLAWRQKEPRSRKDNSSTSMFDVEEDSGSSSEASRNKTIFEKALERDRNCIIRRSSPVKITHIYPPHFITVGRARKSSAAKTYPPFWDMLKFFWEPERLAAWQSQMTTNLPYDSLQNLMCLNADLQQMWNEGHFALRPVGYNNDKTTLKLEFIWQADHKKSIGNRVPANDPVLSSRGLSGIDDSYYVTARINGEVRKLRMDDEISLSTTDPVGSIVDLLETSDDDSDGCDLPVGSIPVDTRVYAWLENTEEFSSIDEAETEVVPR
ncbi:hypothetical protein AbraIFM66951_003241 [Aspergillus brasiliensis]|nr:hypothetical protein AbraIFM66951_003241 [Aspergillus brasiliensis]